MTKKCIFKNCKSWQGKEKNGRAFSKIARVGAREWAKSGRAFSKIAKVAGEKFNKWFYESKLGRKFHKLDLHQT